MHLADKRSLRYYQVADGFSNPNALVNIQVLNWVCESVKYCNERFSRSSGVTSELRSAGRKSINILELFCGNGNHTNAIAGACTTVPY